MKLAICIPTHHGRARHLEELLESILHHGERSGGLADVQICISDNASSDATEDLIRRYMARFGTLFKYHRNSTNTGVRNFFTVIDMADADYCWLTGSDDAVVPNAIDIVLAGIAQFPEVVALTVNKLNFNKELNRLIGPDHDQALPANPEVTRLLRGEREILSSLFIGFGYISAHIFKKEAWTGVLQDFGMPHILGYPHFPHTFIYSQIAKKAGEWLWIGDYCVIQRLENFTFFEHFSDKPIVYAEELTRDLQRIAHTVLPAGAVYEAVMSRLFLVYWNPWYALKYRAVTSKSDWAALKVVSKCKRWFRHDKLFWLTTYPVFVMPRFLARLLLWFLHSCHEVLTTKPQLVRFNAAGRRGLHRLLRLIGVERQKSGDHSAPLAAATAYLETAASRRIGGV